MRRREFYAMVGPSAIVMTLLLIVPLIQTVRWSLQRVTYGTPGTWVGFENYVNVLGDARFRASILFTIGLTLVATALKIILGFFLALLLNASGKARPIFLGLLLLSYIVPTVIGATAFSWLFDSNFGGLVNFLLDKVGINGPLWFTDKWPNRLMLLGQVVWHEVPFAVLILLAGLQGVSAESMEAADIDGASWWQKQRFVVIPSLSRLFGFIALVSIMDELRVFDALIPLAPNAVTLGSESVMLYVFNVAFAAGQQNLGLGSAVSVLTLIVILLLLIPFIRQTYRDVVKP